MWKQSQWQHIPLNSIDVTNSYDLSEDNEQQRESGCVVVEYGKPVIPWGGGEAQAQQQTKHTHQTCKKSSVTGAPNYNTSHKED